MSGHASPDPVYDVAVIGGGAAGVGAAVSLRHAGLENFIVLDRHEIGASFMAWPDETRFITPSFPTNSIGMLDLNSIAIGASPAFGLQAEHPTGREYASHLKRIAEIFELPVRGQCDVKSVRKEGDVFAIETADAPLRAKHVIWAAGEFQYPRLNGFAGSEHCRHTATLPNYRGLEGDDFIVVGGYESGIDVAYHLAQRGRRVRLFDKGCPWVAETADPSVALSTYSLERMRDGRFLQFVELFPNVPITAVAREGSTFEVTAGDGRRFATRAQPLLAGGFDGSHGLVSSLFEQRADGFPLLDENDESTITPGLFLCGPSVRHDNHVFCFIYKYRQRFGIVARAIATSLGMPTDELEQYYRQWGMFLDDLSCCGEECAC